MDAPSFGEEKRVEANASVAQFSSQSDDANESVSPPNEARFQKPDVSRATVQVACLPCRTRHLKCDGGVRCSRCVAEGTICSYIKSRRGWKGSRKRSSVQPGSLPNTLHREGVLTPNFELPPTFDPLIPLQQHTALQSPHLTSPAVPFFPNLPNGVDILGQRATLSQSMHLPPDDTSKSGLISTYYSYFHPAHPLMLPHAQMLDLMHGSHLPHLELALQYIGSFYVSAAPTTTYQEALQQSLDDPILKRDGYMVQALLLYGIGLHIADEEELSTAVMLNTINLARELGMDKREFAREAGQNSVLVEEVWRRTWWEIFILDGMFAGVNPIYKMQLHSTKHEVYLPVEDSDLFSLLPINLRTLDDYDNAIFLDENTFFPSSTYRIDAIRLLHKVFSASQASPSETHVVDAADVHLTNWALHLPPSKKKPIDREGNVDEVLFEAHMIVSACTIMLNRPRSDLSVEDVREVTTCVGAGQKPMAAPHTDVHTAKAMQAAKDISGLITLPCPLIKHTPFFTCAVTMGATVFLSYWSFIATESGDAFIKENIRLNIGVLKSLAELMPIAKTVLGQVKGVAQELFQSRKALNNTYWSAVTREEILQDMIEGDTCIDDPEVYNRILMLNS